MPDWVSKASRAFFPSCSPELFWPEDWCFISNCSFLITSSWLWSLLVSPILVELFLLDDIADILLMDLSGKKPLPTFIYTSSTESNSSIKGMKPLLSAPLVVYGIFPKGLLLSIISWSSSKIWDLLISAFFFLWASLYFILSFYIILLFWTIWTVFYNVYFYVWIMALSFLNCGSSRISWCWITCNFSTLAFFLCSCSYCLSLTISLAVIFFSLSFFSSICCFKSCFLFGSLLLLSFIMLKISGLMRVF